MFAEPPADPATAARLSALEAAVAALTQTVGTNAAAAQDAVTAVSGDRESGDQALLDVVQTERDGRVISVQAVDDRIGNEILRATDKDQQHDEQLGQLGDLADGIPAIRNELTLGVAEASERAAMAGAAADSAEQALAATQAVAGGGPYASIAAGMAAVADGAPFLVIDGDYLKLYRRSGAVAVDQNYSIASAQLVAGLRSLIDVATMDGPDEIMADANGYVSATGLWVHADGFEARHIGSGKLLYGTNGNIFLQPGLEVYEADIAGVLEVSVDQNGWVIEYRDSDGVVHGAAAVDPEPEPEPDPEPLSVLPISSASMFFVPGKPMPLYTKNLILDRTDDPHTVISWLSWTVGGEKQAYGLETSDRLLYVDPAKLCVNNRLTTRVYGPVTDTINYRVIGARIANVPAASAPIVIHPVGSSIANRGVAAGLQTHLTAFGYAPSFIGSLRGAASGANYTDDTGPLGDGHEGWGFTHLTYRQTVAGGAAIIPLPVGQETTYLAMSKADQQGYNVFLRAPDGGNPNDAAETFNGYVFDYDFGRTRWPVPWAAPDIILMGDMFTNDLKTTWPLLEGAQLDNAIAQGEAAMRQVITSIRRSLSMVKIALWMPVLANKSKYAYGGSDARWPANARVCAILDALVREKNAAGDGNIALSPVWLHMSAECDMLGAALDPATGIYTSSHQGTVHPDIMAREQMIFALFATVAAFFNGASAA